MTRTWTAAAAAFGFALLAGAAGAAEIEVQMLNKGADGAMVFEPALVRIQPGDSVRFLPVDLGHNAESIKGMTPDDAEPFKGALNKELLVTFDKPGVYGYECKPHYALGMVGLIVVGDGSPNLEDAKAVKHPGKAQARMNKLFDELGQ